jgi:hypothetical protein
MSGASNFNRWFIVTVALVVGFLIGLAFTIYLVYAWVPANIILRDAPPRFLEYSPSGQPVGYRDIYVARVANRFAASDQSPAALGQAQNSLGVTSGDATPMEAYQMAASAEQAARLENASPAEAADPNAGYFTLADQSNLQLLTAQLDQVKDQPAVVAQDVVDARRNAAIYGLLLLLLFTALLGGVLLLISNWLAPEVAPVPVATPVTMVPAASIGPVDEIVLEDARVDHSAATAAVAGAAAGAAVAAAVTTPTEPGTPVTPMVSPFASPVEGESLLNTFNTVYVHGDERYDEGFPINATSGEMIGECGASVAEKIGLEVPAPVAALAVWVFDKSDFHSKTKVLVTPYVYANDVIRAKVSERGEVIQARPNLLFEVPTGQLRVEVEVRTLQMRPSGANPDAYFERVNLEFRVFKRT